MSTLIRLVCSQRPLGDDLVDRRVGRLVMETVVERPGGAGCAQGAGHGVRACARGRAAAREQHVAEFATTVAGLLALRDWLRRIGVTQVAMEATGVYWKPVWAILEDEFECMLVNARHVKQVPGRKTDVSDARVAVPAAGGRAAARELRAAQADPHAAEPDPVSQDADPGAPARGQPAAQGPRGHRDQARLRRHRHPRQVRAGDARRADRRARPTPRCWPSWPRAGCARRSPRCSEALEGRFDHSTRLWIGAILAHIDFLDEQIARLSEAIEEQIAPFEPAVELLCTIPGVQRRTAEVIIAEIGTDMSVLPDRRAPRLLGRPVPRQRPVRRQAPLRARPARAPSGSDLALDEAALAAIRTKDTYLAAQYRRLRPRRGHNKALGAVKHSILIACWHMLTTGELYRDLGGDYFRTRDPERLTKRLVAQLEALGHTVTLEAAAA